MTGLQSFNAVPGRDASLNTGAILPENFPSVRTAEKAGRTCDFLIEWHMHKRFGTELTGLQIESAMSEGGLYRDNSAIALTGLSGRSNLPEHWHISKQRFSFAVI